MYLSTNTFRNSQKGVESNAVYSVISKTGETKKLPKGSRKFVHCDVDCYRDWGNSQKGVERQQSGGILTLTVLLFLRKLPKGVEREKE